VVSTAAILSIMAHADDAELWAGATLARHAKFGAVVTIALPNPNAPRAAEALAGAEKLGATVRLLDHLTVFRLTELLIELRPEVVITHHPDDMHPDHRAAADITLAAVPDAVIATGHPRRTYACDSYNNLDRYGRPLDLPAIIDATATWDTKMQALACHHGTQPINGHFAPMAEALGRLHGRRIERAYGEAFRSLPILGRMPETVDL
jgi:N-acetylglucosamine malate deacetylase 1